MIEALLAALAGLAIGSFLNVCIYRMPRDLSVIRPRSFCPTCERSLAWYDNIPLASYAVLRGRCRHCGNAISPRYPVVELLTGSLFFFQVLSLGPTLQALKLCLFSGLLVGLIFSDLEQRILPDEFTLGGTAVGLALAALAPLETPLASLLFPWDWGPRGLSFAEALVGAVVGSGVLWLIGIGYQKARGREGLGFGDVKMVAMIGAFLGLYGVLVTVLVGSVLGSVLGLLFIVWTRKKASTYELPFGTFLGLAALGIALLWRPGTG